MKRIIITFLMSLNFCVASVSFAQDSLVTELARINVTTFSKVPEGFKGTGWDKIISLVKQSNYILIGEDHFTNEIPYFFSSLTSQVTFNNFFCEIDPYSASILQNKIKTMSAADLSNYVADYGNTFSFYALKPEFDLLKQMVKSKTTIYGTDQILMVADRLICNELQQQTGNKAASKIYGMIRDSSKQYFDDFLKDQSNPIYLLTADFDKKVHELLQLKLPKKEVEIIEALKLTAKIYKEQNHHLRVQLMKNELMKVYPWWNDTKSLFKYGANHLPKGESLLKIYDIGNLVNNIADSKFENSLHIMIVGQAGTQGSPFDGFPEQQVDENSDNLKPLKPLFKAMNGEDWHCFDMLPIRKALENKKIIVKDIELTRIIKGYDMVVIIPTVTAAKFATK